MKHTAFVRSVVLALSALTLVASCAGTTRVRRTNVLEYLYPEGTEAVPPQDVHLELPLAVGLAFVPEGAPFAGETLHSTQRDALLSRMRDAFLDVEGIERIEVVPGNYLTPEGGFENVDRIRRALGIDLIVLVSFDQTQFDDPNLASITYWTVVGAYVVPGNENETHTLLDASVFDIASRSLLLNASGRSVVAGRSTALDLERSLREDREAGFASAVDDLIANLGTALEQFRQQAATGTVRGQGTPAIEITSTQEGDGGSTGAGTLGAPELAVALPDGYVPSTPLHLGGALSGAVVAAAWATAHPDPARPDGRDRPASSAGS